MPSTIEVGLNREEIEVLSTLVGELQLLTYLDMTQLNARKDKNSQLGDDLRNFLESRKTMPSFIVHLELKSTLQDHLNGSGNGALIKKVNRLINFMAVSLLKEKEEVIAH